MAKVTVYLNDELYAQLKQKDVNLSKLCRIAAEQHLEELDARPILKEDSSLNETIKRLKEERNQYRKESFDSGVQAGIEWAKQADYGELVDYATQEFPAKAAVNPWEWLPEEDQDLGVEFQEEYGSFDERQFVSGWYAGVRLVWRHINRQLAE